MPLSQSSPGSSNVWGILLTGAVGAARRPLPAPSRDRVHVRETIGRASELISARRLVAVSARDDAEAGPELTDVQRVVQPAYRGSAAEVFLPLLMVARREPSAIVVVLPVKGGGHYDGDFMRAVGRGTDAVTHRPDLLLVIGTGTPFSPARGWIETGDAIAGLEHLGVRAVRRFVRRRRQLPSLPPLGDAIVNTEVVIAQAQTLLALGRRRLPDVLESLEPLETVFGGPEEPLLCEAVYEGMPYADLSHALFAAEEPVGVLPVLRAETRIRQEASA
jgi:mannose-1-phosphate guanylyltransferase